MNGIKVYHGGSEVVEHPLCCLGRENLDFGQGFYVTDIEEQTNAWTKRMKVGRGGEALVNVYVLDKDTILREAKCKVFTAYDLEWLRFVVANRLGKDVASKYDYIEGGVADDRVIDSVNLFMTGFISEEETLRRLAMHQPNNQICIRKQELIEKYLNYERTERV